MIDQDADYRYGILKGVIESTRSGISIDHFYFDKQDQESTFSRWVSYCDVKLELLRHT